nr:PKD domain-containing protein [Deltaproteobacteria bacterium]
MRYGKVAIIALAGLIPDVAAAGGNFPPVADVQATPEEALVGELIMFSAAGSFDPDNGPQPLTYDWDFGDGTGSTEIAPTHGYDAEGLYVVTLTVGDGLATHLVNLAVVALAPPAAVRPRSSAPLSLSPDDGALAVVNPDADTVSIIDTTTFAVEEIAVGGEPRSVAWSLDGATIYIACRGAHELWVVDATTAVVAEQVPVDPLPIAVVVRPGDGDVVVVSEGLGTAERLDAVTLERQTRVEGLGTPRAVALPPAGNPAYITQWLTRGEQGEVMVVDLDAAALTQVATLAEDEGPDSASSGRGFPNVLGTAAIGASGQTLWVGGLKANTGRGTYVSGEPMEPRNRLRGLLAPVDVATGIEMAQLRIDTNDADSVSGVAFSPRGRYAYVAHQGAGRLSVYDLPAAALVDTADGSSVDFEVRLDVGDAPHGVVVDAAGERAYVANFMSRDVTVLDLASLSQPTVLDTVATTVEPLPPVVAEGKRLFYRSREPLHSDQNYIACASCHPDGGHDGRTWDFTQFGEGLRNTVELRGRAGMGHGPVHWSANFDEIQDFENDIQGGFGGDGLLPPGERPHPPLAGPPNAGRSAELDALAAYVSTLDVVPPSPWRQADGSLGEAAVRGMVLFFDPAVGCADCHVPPRFTDSTLTADRDDFVLHDVGTLSPASGQRLGGPLPGIDTPTLLGVWATAPYLHDGRASTLLEVITTHNAGDAHGATSVLDDGERD